jgi:GNAT superfamily N-acetyltransferase
MNRNSEPPVPIPLANAAPALVESVGFATDLLLYGIDGRVERRPDYLLAERAGVPGNSRLLLFEHPPGADDFEQWQAKAFRGVEDARNVQVTVGWDDPEGERGFDAPFLENGFSSNPGAVLSCGAPRLPENADSAVTVRPIQSECDWMQVLECNLGADSERRNDALYRQITTDYVLRSRARVRCARGEWFGAFLDDALVASLGIFVFGDLARYQSVVTDEAHRRRGIGRRLVYETACHVIEQFDAHRLIILCSPDNPAVTTYEAVGFSITERQAALLKRASV